AHHVLRAVGEVDDVEEAEDDGQPQAQHGVERAIDEADEELAEESLGRDAEYSGHHSCPPLHQQGRGQGEGAVTAESCNPRPSPSRWEGEGMEPSCYFFTSGHSPWSSGRNAWSAGMVARILYRSHGPFDSAGFFTSTR